MLCLKTNSKGAAGLINIELDEIYESKLALSRLNEKGKHLVLQQPNSPRNIIRTLDCHCDSIKMEKKVLETECYIYSLLVSGNCMNTVQIKPLEIICEQT
jgi:hypothetical protein